MNYTIELNKDELKLLKHLLKDRLDKSDSTIGEDLDIILMLGKLDNVIMVADKITEDTSILAKRKYSLFRRR